jgi:hypothetical protein
MQAGRAARCAGEQQGRQQYFEGGRAKALPWAWYTGAWKGAGALLVSCNPPPRAGAWIVLGQARGSGQARKSPTGANGQRCAEPGRGRVDGGGNGGSSGAGGGRRASSKP